MHRLLCLYFTSISIHALLAESDISKRRYYHDKRYFYPRSPCGERRPRCAGIWFAACNFYPRSPCGERPITPVTGLFWQKFLSTLSLRRATLKSSISTKSALFLSTLSLRRATNAGCRRCSTHYYFYPRSPCGERRRRPSSPLHHPYFYPRSPCGERLQVVNVEQDTIDISIHALLAESDDGRRTGFGSGRISIHALLAESD